VSFFFRFDLTRGPYRDCKPTTPAGHVSVFRAPSLHFQGLTACRRSQLKIAATPGKIEPPLGAGALWASDTLEHW
jgi:hypothetical protein